MDNNAFVFYLEKPTIQLLRINILAETSIKIANGFLKRLCISYCPAFSYSVRTIRRKTNRKQIEIQKSVFYQVWIKKSKSSAMPALLWLTDASADCWKDGAPMIFDVIDFRVWVPLRISEAILFFTPNNVWLCLSVFINTERHFNTRHLDYRAATPYKYCSDCYGEFINVILGGRHYSVWHTTLSFYRIWVIILSTQ